LQVPQKPDNLSLFKDGFDPGHRWYACSYLQSYQTPLSKWYLLSYQFIMRLSSQLNSLRYSGKKHDELPFSLLANPEINVLISTWSSRSQNLLLNIKSSQILNLVKHKINNRDKTKCVFKSCHYFKRVELDPRSSILFSLVV